MSLADLIELDHYTLKCYISALTIKKFELLVKQCADLNIQTVWGFTFLHVLCMTNDKNSKSLPKMKLLIDHGANPNIKNLNDDSPLHILCEWSNIRKTTLSQIKLLINAGADVNSVNNCGQSPLCIACNDYQTKKNYKYYNILLMLLNCSSLRIPISGHIYDRLRSFRATITYSRLSRLHDAIDSRLLILHDAIDRALDRSWITSARCIFITAVLGLGEAESQASPFIMGLRQKALLCVS
jgi:hypothetical protein